VGRAGRSALNRFGSSGIICPLRLVLGAPLS
jgi:hypothetical protein